MLKRHALGRLNNIYMLHDSGLDAILFDSTTHVLALSVSLSEESNDIMGWYGKFTFYDVSFVTVSPAVDELTRLLQHEKVSASISTTSAEREPHHGEIVTWFGSLWAYKPFSIQEVDYLLRFTSSGFTWLPDRTRPNPFAKLNQR